MVLGLVIYCTYFFLTTAVVRLSVWDFQQGQMRDSVQHNVKPHATNFTVQQLEVLKK